jgi:endonuclease YncB( thermonuclease family)
MEVYLDLDNLAVGGVTGRPYRDRYERLVAVIYVKLDGQWINVNAELLRWGQEEYPDHDWLKYRYITSEFDGLEWLAENYPYVRG